MRWILIITLFVLGCKEKGIDPRVLSLPELNVQMLDSSRVMNTADIAAGVPTILMYFDPGCQFSREQTETIIKHYDSLKHIRFYMISSGPMQKLHDYYTHYRLDRFGNIIMGRDHELFFEKELKVPSFPWLFIYSPDKKLKRILTGSSDVQTILSNVNG